MAKHIILLGAPGVGKGTLGQEVVRRAGLAYVSTGDMLRSEVAAKTPLGNKIASILAAGELVNDDLVNELIKKALERPESRNGYMLDGYPRTLYQAKTLEALPQGKIDIVFNIELPTEEIVRRISSRRSCPKCKAVYNLLYSAPKKAGACDKCGTGLVTRSDDTPETIRNRIAVYEKNTKPLVEYYEKKGVLVRIDSSGSDNEPKIRKMLAVIGK
ncbi:MAG: nucleoside monophosphate kinase [Candidatus Micrarchaeia archaeon]